MCVKLTRFNCQL